MSVVNTELNLRRIRQTGLTLIELMVAMALGLLVVLAVSQVFVGTKRSVSGTADLAKVQEGARFGADTMVRHLRLAGYHPVNARENFSSTQINCGGVGDPQQAICGVNDAAPNVSDSVRIRFFGSDGSTPGVADRATLDCQGNALSSTDIVEERWLLADVRMNPADATTQRTTLVCDLLRGAAAITAGAPVTRVPVVYGVDRMQLLYGEDTDGDGAPDLWRHAGLANMSRVVAVQVAMIMIGEDRGPGVTAADPQIFRAFGAGYPAAGDAGAVYTAPADNRFRKMYTSSVLLRNRG